MGHQRCVFAQIIRACGLSCVPLLTLQVVTRASHTRTMSTSSAIKKGLELPLLCLTR
jgi:hypothetical protein